MGDPKAQVTEDIVERTSNIGGGDSKSACRVHSKYELHYELVSIPVWCSDGAQNQLLQAIWTLLAAPEHFQLTHLVQSWAECRGQAPATQRGFCQKLHRLPWTFKLGKCAHAPSASSGASDRKPSA